MVYRIGSICMRLCGGRAAIAVCESDAYADSNAGGYAYHRADAHDDAHPYAYAGTAESFADVRQGDSGGNAEQASYRFHREFRRRKAADGIDAGRYHL